MFNRRQMIGGSISGFFAFAARNRFSQLFAEESRSAVYRPRAKRCIVLWMEGGPSQLDTFDPKPGTATGGPTQSISTSAAGIRISEHLPAVARQMKHLSVIRNLTSNEGEHIRARYYLHTGFEFVPSFPRPALGSVISHETPTADFPKFVSLGSAGLGPAYLGPQHAPFSVDNPESARQLLRTIGRRRDRLALLQQLDAPFNAAQRDPRIDLRNATLEKIAHLASTGFSQALDVDSLSAADRGRYGSGQFGRRCLVARQLLELGVPFVEVQQGGWDSHANNFDSVRRLCEQIDKPFAALIEDLQSSGMYDDTLILWMGEFGRTPTINARQGRDHFPLVTPVVIGGGRIATGLAVGSTNSLGNQIDGDSYRVADLFATIFAAFGIQPDREFRTAFDSPTTATDDGTIIKELL